jgi:hypothetical protein
MKKELTSELYNELCLQSGLSKKTYCKENNLSYVLFFYFQLKKMKRICSTGFFAKNLIFLIVASDRSRQLFLPQGRGVRGVAKRGLLLLDALQFNI